MAATPALGVLLSWRVLRERTLTVTPLLIAAAYAMLILLAAFSHPGNEKGISGLIAPAAVALVATFVGAVMSPREMNIVARVIIALASAQALFAVAEVQFQDSRAREIAAVPELGTSYVVRENLLLQGDFSRASGTMGHPILLGAICAVAFILVLARIRTSVLWAVPLLALLGWGVALSGSRSVVAAVLIAGIWYLLHPGTPLAHHWRLPLVLASPPAAYWYITTTADEARRVSAFSLDNRLAAWDRLLEALDRSGGTAVFGEGLEWTISRPTAADNQILTTTGQLGLLGMAVLLAAIWMAARTADPGSASLAVFFGVMFLSFDALAWQFTTVAFWLLLGLVRARTTAVPLPSASVPIQTRATAGRA